MNDTRPLFTEAAKPKTTWKDLFRDGRGLYSLLVILGTMLHALQMLVMAIIMPTVVADIGGAAYYTWASMLYMIGAIVGAAAVAPVWTALGGARRGYAASAIAFLLGTLGCALAPDMAYLNITRTVQGLAGGLVAGGNMALVGGLFASNLRTRILAIHQATFTASHLLGPLAGGVFASLGWWRGSFWALIPFTVLFAALAWLKIPDQLGNEVLPGRTSRLPFFRLAMMATGVFCIALAGLAKDATMRTTLILGTLVLLWLTFRLDRKAKNKLFPANALSVYSPVGLSLWIIFCTGSVQAAVTLFLPLLLQVVHGVTPVFISMITIVISFGWTVGTFSVSGWAGKGERFALRVGPLLMIAGLTGIIITARMQTLTMLAGTAFIYGIGIGVHNVHLIARAMAAALKGEERITASAMQSIRSLGTAFGAAQAGLLSTIAGLGDARAPQAVGAAVTFVYSFNLIPLVIAALLMMRLVSMGRPAPDRPSAAPHPGGGS